MTLRCQANANRIQYGSGAKVTLTQYGAGLLSEFLRYPQLAQNALQKSANLRPTLAFSESNRFLGIKLIILNARLHYLQ